LDKVCENGKKGRFTKMNKMKGFPSKKTKSLKNSFSTKINPRSEELITILRESLGREGVYET